MTHETRDLSTRVVVSFAISLVVGAIVVHVAVWVAATSASGASTSKAYPREYPLANVGAPAGPAGAPPPDAAARGTEGVRAEEDRCCPGTGGPTRRPAGSGFPIDRAMQLLLEQGLPARAAAPAGRRAGATAGFEFRAHLAPAGK